MHAWRLALARTVVTVVLQLCVTYYSLCCLFREITCFISWPATMWGPAIVMVRVVPPSICHTRISPKLSETDVWLLGNSNRNLSSRFRVCHRIRERKYGSAILGVSGSALGQLTQKWGSWPYHTRPFANPRTFPGSNELGGTPAIVPSHRVRYLVCLFVEVSSWR